ncbi:MAG: HEAT repeat domain-containing protein [Bacteroidales bacterium]|nr:HEAT repeat domain-containing protein [Bacteroidales bacterium]
MAEDKQWKMLEKIREIALKNPEKIRIVETNVDADVQLEYYALMQKLGERDLDKQIPAIINELLTSEDLDSRKRLLVSLAVTGEIEAYRFLEQYLVDCDDDIKKWALLSCQQCQMFLESSLLDESKIYVASGLGGKNHRLRYVFAIFGVEKADFTDFHKKVIANETKYYLEKFDSVCEDLQYIENYAVCTALVPLYEDVVALVQSIIDEVNQYGGFVKQSIFVTNEKHVDKEALDKMYYSDEDGKD